MSNITVSTKLEWNGDYIKHQGKKVIDKSIWEIGLIVEGRAKELCARRYGYLAASINTQSRTEGTNLESPSKYAKEATPKEHNIGSFVTIEKPAKDNWVYVGTNVDYAAHIEFGTIKMTAQPFLRPALDLASGRALTIIQLNGKNYFGEYLNARDIFLAV